MILMDRKWWTLIAVCAGMFMLLLDGKPPALPLDSFFALNPAMPNLHRLYKAEQATIVHATATPHRERSHFDGQDVLESGFAGPGRVQARLEECLVRVNVAHAGQHALVEALLGRERGPVAEQPGTMRRSGNHSGGASR